MKNKKLIYILSFFIPAFIFTLIMMLKHVTPFGHNTVLGSDLLSQYSSFYTELAYKLRHGNSLFYSFTQGLGTDYLNQASYYVISPLNIILIFFNSRTMPIAITILLILKCGLAGLSMSIYIKKHYYSLSTGIDHVIITLCVSTC